MLSDSNAIISVCGQFRYALTRRWGSGPSALFIMLNPSTAGASVDDPTIRRCIAFAKREGCGGFQVENLYGFRATNPEHMFSQGDAAIGETDRFILLAAANVSGPLICAWGADKRAKQRAQHVTAHLKACGATPLCLGRTKDGSPRHPLYVKGDAPIVPFDVPDVQR